MFVSSNLTAILDVNIVNMRCLPLVIVRSIASNLNTLK